MQDYEEELLDISWLETDSVCEGLFFDSEMADDEAYIDECADL